MVGPAEDPGPRRWLTWKKCGSPLKRILASVRYGNGTQLVSACDERSNGHRAETDQLREVLAVTRDLWELASQLEDEPSQRRAQRGALRLVHLASVLSVTNAA